MGKKTKSRIMKRLLHPLRMPLPKFNLDTSIQNQETIENKE
jgi:hypothetical protein